MEDFTSFDRDCLLALLTAADPARDWASVLPQLAVKHRETTGVGYFVELTSRDEARPLAEICPLPVEPGTTLLEIELTENPEGAFAALHRRDGTVDYLEVCTYAGSWPETPTGYQLRPAAEE